MAWQCLSRYIGSVINETAGLCHSCQSFLMKCDRPAGGPHARRAAMLQLLQCCKHCRLLMDKLRLCTGMPTLYVSACACHHMLHAISGAKWVQLRCICATTASFARNRKRDCSLQMCCQPASDSEQQYSITAQALASGWGPFNKSA